MLTRINALDVQLGELQEEAQRAVKETPKDDQTRMSFYMLLDCKSKIQFARKLLDMSRESLQLSYKQKEAGK